MLICPNSSEPLKMGVLKKMVVIPRQLTIFVKPLELKLQVYTLMTSWLLHIQVHCGSVQIQNYKNCVTSVPDWHLSRTSDNYSKDWTELYPYVQVKLMSLIARTCHMNQKPADLRVSSLQCWLSSPEPATITPESCKLLILRSRCFREEDWELRKKAIGSQHFHVSAQLISLKKDEI